MDPSRPDDGGHGDDGGHANGTRDEQGDRGEPAGDGDPTDQVQTQSDQAAASTALTTGRQAAPAPASTNYSPVLATAEGSSDAAFQPLDWVLLAIPALAWGSSFLLTAEALEGLHPGAVTWLRLLLGFAALSVFPSAWRTRVKRGDWPRVVVVGAGWMAIPMSMFAIAQQWLSSAVTGMLNGSLPLVSAVVASILLRRMPRRLQMVGLTLGLVGIVAISVPSLGGGSNNALGTAIVAASMLVYGLAVNEMVPLQLAYGAIPVVWRALGFATVVTAPFGVFGLLSSSFPLGPVVAVVVLGVVATGLAFIPAGWLMGRVGATRGSVNAYLTPIVALVLGVTVRSDSVEWLQVGGLAAALAGAVLLSRGNS